MSDSAGKKKGLGRGLSHLFGEAQAAYGATGEGNPPDGASSAESGRPRTVPVAWLGAGRFQPRRQFDEAALDELATSIRAHGLIQPILVRPLDGAADRYEIIAGERRWRAAQRAGLHDVPVLVQSLTDSQALEIALVENLQRQDLTALEEAEGYQRLINEFAHSHAVLGELVGKSRSHVANMLRLLTLPDSIKELVTSGALSAGHARALLTAPDPERLARQVVERGLSVRETERLAGHARREPQSRPGGARPVAVAKHVDVLALEHDLTHRLGLKVSIASRGSGGVLSVEYRSLDQLDGLIESLSRG